MKRLLILLFLSVFTMLGMSEELFAGQCGTGQTSTFLYPFITWTPSGNPFLNERPSGYHAGVDGVVGNTSNQVGQSVYAPCTGVVKDASEHNGYGGMVILECYTGDECVTSYLGHMFTNDTTLNGVAYRGLQVKVGNSVVVGQTKIGELADYQNNGYWDPHSHFGIRKGDYYTIQHDQWGANDCDGGWDFQGYFDSPTSCAVSHSYNPDDFVPKHSIGYLSTGPSSYKDMFQQVYFKEGVNASYPYPMNYVHDWASTQVQDLCKENVGINGICPTDHNAMLMRNPNNGNVSLFKGGFWSLWNDFHSLTGQEIGYPKSSEEPDPLVSSGKGVLQHFDNGIFYWDPDTRLVSARRDGEKEDYRFCWNGTKFQTTTAYSCPQVAVSSDWISPLVTANTILSAYGGGSGNSPYTPPAGTGGCTATAPNLSYFLDKGGIQSITITPEGDIYATVDTVYTNCQSTRNFYLSHDQGLTWEMLNLSGTPDPATISLYPYLQHALGFYLTNGNVGFLEGGTLYTLPSGQFQPIRLAFWDKDTYFYSAHVSSRAWDVCLVDAGRETCGWGSSYNYKFFIGEDSSGKPIIFSDYYQDLTYRKGSYGDRYYPGVRGYGDIQAMIEDPTDPSKFLIFFQGGELWEGRTDASSFKKLGSAPTSNWYNTSVLRGNPKDPNILYLTYGGKLYRSADRGKTWTAAFSSSTGLDAIDVSWDGKIVYMNTGKITPWAEPKFAN